MTQRDIRAYLRGATDDRSITSWKQIHADLFHVVTRKGRVLKLNTAKAAAYATGLAIGGTQPLYIETELLPPDLAAHTINVDV